jgi:hypothetical protein
MELVVPAESEVECGTVGILAQQQSPQSGEAY